MGRAVLCDHCHKIGSAFRRWGLKRRYLEHCLVATVSVTELVLKAYIPQVAVIGVLTFPQQPIPKTRPLSSVLRLHLQGRHDLGPRCILQATSHLCRTALITTLISESLFPLIHVLG